MKYNTTITDGIATITVDTNEYGTGDYLIKCVKLEDDKYIRAEGNSYLTITNAKKTLYPVLIMDTQLHYNRQFLLLKVVEDSTEAIVYNTTSSLQFILEPYDREPTEIDDKTCLLNSQDTIFEGDCKILFSGNDKYRPLYAEITIIGDELTINTIEYDEEALNYTIE